MLAWNRIRSWLRGRHPPHTSGRELKVRVRRIVDETADVRSFELVSADDDGPIDISGERERAEHLVAANRLYRQTALATGDTGIADLLDELERVLVDLAASPEEISPEDLNAVRRRIESRSLLFKVRVVSSEVRQRQQSVMQERAAGRSSL